MNNNQDKDKKPLTRVELYDTPSRATKRRNASPPSLTISSVRNAVVPDHTHARAVSILILGSSTGAIGHSRFYWEFYWQFC